MPYCEPNDLKVIACPACESFAEAVTKHLRHIYKHRFTLKLEALSRLYGLEKDQIIEKINLENDLATGSLVLKGKREEYRIPNFKVDTSFTYFANGEFKTEINETIRGKDIYIFQDVENHEYLSFNGDKNKISLSVNDNIMCLLVTIDAARLSGARSISLVLPVFPYSRQHKRKGREGLTASMLSHICQMMGVKRIITLDIHSREIINAFSSTNLENLHASYQIIRELSKIVDLKGKSEDIVVVSPDTGAIDRNKFYAAGLKLSLAMIYKERDYSIVTQNANQTNIKAVKLLGDVKGKVAFLADDMLGTGGTLLKAMSFLKENGATKVIAAISLPFFTGNAVELFDEAYKKGLFYRIIGTNAVYHEDLLKKEWYISTDVSGLFANVITRIQHDQSIGDLLDNRNIIERIVKI